MATVPKEEDQHDLELDRQELDREEQDAATTYQHKHDGVAMSLYTKNNIFHCQEKMTAMSSKDIDEEWLHQAEEILQSTPYMREELKQGLLRQFQDLKETHPERYGLGVPSQETQRASGEPLGQSQELNDLSDAELLQICGVEGMEGLVPREFLLQSAQVKQEFALVKQASAACAALKTAWGAPVSEYLQIMAGIQSTHDMLSALAQCSQAESTFNLGTNTKAAAASYHNKHMGESASSGHHVDVQKMLDEKQDWDSGISNFDDVSHQHLKTVGRKWKDLIENSAIVDDADNRKDKIQKTMNWWLQDLEGGKNDTKPELFFPGLFNDEVPGTQVAVIGLVKAIASSLSLESVEPDKSPFKKTRLKREAITAETPSRHQRKVDIAVDKEGRFHLVMLDNAISLPLELKVEKEELHNVSMEQSLSHQAKLCFHGLNFLGVGTSTWATGVTGSLAFITVHRLELTMPGDHPKPSLVYRQSMKFPLVDSQSFDKFCLRLKRNTKKATGAEALRKELYGDDGKDGVNEAKVPHGIVILSHLMKKPRVDLFGPDYAKLFGSDNMNNTVMGTGAFSVVLKEDDNVVLKVATMPSAIHLKTELKALKELGNHQRIATLVGEGEKYLSFCMGGVKRKIMGLRLSPLGQPFIAYVSRLDQPAVSGFFKTVSDDLESALQYIHSKGVHHNDLTPKNAVIESNTGSVRAVLVDFGIAACAGDQLVGFQGTVPYVHKNIFYQYAKKEWSPKNEYDFLGLGYAMAALACDKGKTFWKMNSFPRTLQNREDKTELDSILNDRYTLVVQKLDNAGLDKAGKWKSWIESDRPALQDVTTTVVPKIPEISGNRKRSLSPKK